MALDNVSAGIGLLGFLLLLISRVISPLPPLKPLFALLTPEILEALVEFPKKIFRTDFNQHLISYFVVYRTVLKRKNNLEKILLLLSISSLILSLSIIFEAFTWQNVKHLNWHHMQLHCNTVRAHGLFNHPLTTAGVVFPLFFLFAALYLQFRKSLYLLVSISLFIALIFTGSRSYWVGFGVFLLALVVLFGRKKEVWIAALSLVLLGTVSLKIPYVKYRLESITNTKTNWSNLDRLILWNAHLTAFTKDYSLSEKLFGTGYKASNYAWKRFPSSFKRVTGKAPPKPTVLKTHFHGGLTHDIYLKYLTKYGIFGVLGYLSFWLLVLYKNLKGKNNYTFLIKTLIAGYLGFLAAGIFENNFVDAEVKFTVMFVLGLNFALLHLNSERKLLHQKELS